MSGLPTESALQTEMVGDSARAAGSWLPSGALRDMLLLAAIWIASLFVVNPIGNFPLNDDWSFGLAVKHLLETGEFRPTGWTAMTLITQTLWGCLFCLPCGFSFNALRLSTLVLAPVGTLMVYLLVRQVHPSRLLAGLAALTLGFNPIYFALSNTFMTDVPFLVLLLVAAWFFCRNLRGGSDLDLYCGLAFSLAATLCRQPGLAAPLAFLVCLFWRRGLSARWLIRGLLPIGICLCALLGFEYWMRTTGRTPDHYKLKNQDIAWTFSHPKALVAGMAKHIGTASLYLGWFALPVIVFLLPANLRTLKSRRSFIIGLCAGVVFGLSSVAVLAINRSPMPTVGNVIMSQGIGPLSLRDLHILALPHVASIGKGFWLAVTAASLFGGAFLIGAAGGLLAETLRSRFPAKIGVEGITGVFCLVCGGIYFVPFLVLGGWDRYYVPILPFLLVGMAAVAARSGEIRTKACGVLATLLLAGLFLFSVFGTRDYLAWNRARWTASRELLADGKVTPADVDGGLEFNGWYLYDSAYQVKPGKSWYWVDRDSYVLAFAGMPGYAVVKEYPYTRWLPPGAGKIVVLRKDPP